MSSITLKQLEKKSLLNTLVELAQEQLSSGTIEGHVLNVTLMKQLGLTRSASLKVLKLAKEQL